MGGLFDFIKTYVSLHPEKVQAVKDYAVAHPKTSIGVGLVVAAVGVAAAIPATGVAATLGTAYAAVAGAVAAHSSIVSALAGSAVGAFFVKGTPSDGSGSDNNSSSS